LRENLAVFGVTLRAAMPARRTFYPEIEPFQSGFLQVSDRHSLYYEQSGDPGGKPVVFLHGGPGG
jgi:proline iminopeptidase